MPRPGVDRTEQSKGCFHVASEDPADDFPAAGRCRAEAGIGAAFLINLAPTLIGWLPGVIQAFRVNTRGGETLARRLSP